ncbi:MAG: type II secretion system protein M [Limnohabitans sp.]|nr:type II secretion system protein M [Limnohabitans sp.]
MSGFDRSAMTARWQQLSARERLWITIAGTLIALSLLWQVGLSPAWQAWRQSPARHAQLDRQAAELQSLQMKARELQARPILSRGEALQSFTQLTRDLLPGAQISALADQQRVTLKGASATGLTQWLVAVRQSAQANVVELRLQRNTASQDKQPQWDGQIVVQLPQRGAP